ncbi:hypothetical protein ABK040_002328 [Willaertia magna]
MKITVAFAFLALILTLLIQSLFASEPRDISTRYVNEEILKDPAFLKDYFTISNISISSFENVFIKNITERRATTYLKERKSPQKATRNLGGLDINQILDYASKAWEFIKKNEPVQNFKNFYANALPKGVSSGNDLNSWSAPKSKGYKIVFENTLGMSVVSFHYHLIYQYGGQTANGKGRYLDGVHFAPTDIEVMWGFTFDCNVEVPSIVNAGTATDPIAQMMIELQYSIKSLLKVITNTVSFSVRGDGVVTKLN